MKTVTIEQLKAARQSNRSVYVYPKKQRVSLDGVQVKIDNHNRIDWTALAKEYNKKVNTP